MMFIRARRGIPPLPLDVQGSATAAFSFARRLSRARGTSPILRLRRSSDNAQSDFGCRRYRETVDLDAVAAFIGAGSGFIVTSYDQSGNGNDISQATTTAQPQFILNGLNGRPIARFDGVNDTLARASGNYLRNVSGTTVLIVAKLASVAASTSKALFQVETPAAGVVRVALFADRTSDGKFEARGRRLDADAGAGTLGVLSDTNWHVHCVVNDYANAVQNIYDDGTLIATTNPFQTAGNSSDTASNSLSIASGNSNAFMPGDVAECLLYPSVVSAALIA